MTRRILVFSDIHSNLEAFEAVWADAEKHGSYDARLSAGDVVGYGPDPNAVIQRVKEYGFKSVIGNHDRMVIGHRDYLIESGVGFTMPNDVGVTKSDLVDKITKEIGIKPGSSNHTDLLNAMILTDESVKFLKGLHIRPYLDSNNRFAMVHGSFEGYVENPPEGEYLVDDIYVDNPVRAMASMTFLDGNLDKGAVVHDPENTKGSEITRFVSHPEGTIHVPIGIVGHSHIPDFQTSVLALAEIEGVYRRSDDTFIYYTRNSRPYCAVEDSKFSADITKDVVTVRMNLNQLPKNMSRKKPTWFKEGNVDFDSLLNDLFLTKVLVNPGSVGQQRRGSPEATYMIMEIGEDDNVKFEFRKVEYDVATTQRKLRERGYPERFAAMLGNRGSRKRGNIFSG